MEQLRQVAEFRSTPELLYELERHGIRKKFSAGTTIFNEHSYIRSIPIVTKGILRIMRSDDEGVEFFLYYLTAGESCIMAYLGGLHNDTTKLRAVVEEDAEILFLPVDKVAMLNRDYPQWLQYIFRLYHKRFEELLSIINAVSFKRMDERLLDLLLKKAAISESNVIEVTHEQLTNELGTARVVVSRLLKQLELSNRLQLGRITILV